MPAVITLLFFSTSMAQTNDAAIKWADSVYKKLSHNERIAQLMVVRLSSQDPATKKPVFFDKQVSELVKKYNIGGLCLFQGSPQDQARIVNNMQALAKTPILMCIDGEWGLGMRMAEVMPLPKQMMLGAMSDATVVYKYGALVAAQCKRAGIQVNYAPVVDINNNPNNPVINDRSFGEDKYKVADYGVAYMRGMQDNGVMGCAKHFPGHGDVAVDSHFDLPVINKTVAQLDSLELYPFKKMIEAGVGSMMVAHLYIPAIDNTPNRATSLSPQNVTGLLREKLGYNGLTFTDALEMQGIKKFYGSNAASVQSLIAGNDMLCLPGDVPGSIEAIKKAIKKKDLSWNQIEEHCKKVLVAKYMYGLANLQPVNLTNITADLNAGIDDMRRLVAQNAITLVAQNNNALFPLTANATNTGKRIAYLCIGTKTETPLAARMRNEAGADVFYFGWSQTDNAQMLAQLKPYSQVVVGLHNLGRSPASNYNISQNAVQLVNDLQKTNNSIALIFGNAYAAKNFCDAKNLVVCYEDEAITQQTAGDMLFGKIPFKGVLPVTVCPALKFGSGINTTNLLALSLKKKADTTGDAKFSILDSIALDAIAKKATPGCVVMVVKDGVIAYNKAYGTTTFTSNQPVNVGNIYDLASVTKICATTISVMKLYDEGKIDLNDPIGYYLPLVAGSNKENLKLKDILLHQAGLNPYIPFYKATVDSQMKPLPGIYQTMRRDSFTIPVAKDMFMDSNYVGTMFRLIIDSELGPAGKYVYSDNDFILLGKMVEHLSGMPLNEYVYRNFYLPMSLESMGFLPLSRFPVQRIVPTEDDNYFRHQLLQGYVHDQGAAMFGGVSGHAGLYADAYDVACIFQMLMDGGEFNGRQILKKSTVDLFTAYQSPKSRRGFGFDKPEKDNDLRKEPYPARGASAQTFGHTGYTGIGAWADPAKRMVFIFLSNRVNPFVNNALLNMNVRGKLMEAAYKATDD